MKSILCRTSKFFSLEIIAVLLSFFSVSNAQAVPDSLASDALVRPFDIAASFSMDADSFILNMHMQFSHSVDSLKFSTLITDTVFGQNLSDHIAGIYRLNGTAHDSSVSGFLLKAEGKTTILGHEFKKVLYSDCSESFQSNKWIFHCNAKPGMGDTGQLVRSAYTEVSCSRSLDTLSNCDLTIIMHPRRIHYIIFNRSYRQMALAAGHESAIKYAGIAFELEYPSIAPEHLLAIFGKTAVGTFIKQLDDDWHLEEGGALPSGHYELDAPHLQSTLNRQVST